MIKPFMATLPLFILGACASNISTPTQPTPASLEAANTQLMTLTSSPAETWETGDYAVRAACHAYLNSEAVHSSDINALSIGAGIAGAAGSMYNPLAGIASSLVQSFLNASNASGAIPYTPETSTLIMHSLDADESGVNPSSIPDQATAVSLVDDLWFLCSPGGFAMTAATALSTAQVGTMTNAALTPSFSFNAKTPSVYNFQRPITTINGN